MKWFRRKIKRPKIVVFNRKGGIVTSYLSFKEFYKDMFNRDFSFDWSDKFIIHFDQDIWEKFTSSKNKKILVTRTKYPDWQEFMVTERDMYDSCSADELALPYSGFLEYQKSKILHINIFSRRPV